MASDVFPTTTTMYLLLCTMACMGMHGVARGREPLKLAGKVTKP